MVSSGEQFELVRNKRSYATRIAAHLSIESRKNGVSMDAIEWDTLSQVPQWCLDSNDEIRHLQKICGAVYAAPLIKSSIDGVVLRKLSKFLGGELFDALRSADSSHQIAQESNQQSAFNQYPEVEVMAAGSSVLLQTLQVPSLIRLYQEIIGPPSVDVSADLAKDIFFVAHQINDGSLDALGVDALRASDAA